MPTLVIIPARFASTRFPGKPLALIAGKPMIQHVWEKCVKAAGIDRVIVATEDERILSACKSFGAEAEITSAEHASGTDRIAEVSHHHPEFDSVLNVQGDEPAIPSETVSAVAAILQDHNKQISTAIAVLDVSSDLTNPNVVKVALAVSGSALYFSRSPIPFHRDPKTTCLPDYFRHLGIYGFQRNILLEVTKLSPSPLEKAESLEQLRWLQNGYSIHCAKVSTYSIGVDTLDDLKAVEKLLL